MSLIKEVSGRKILDSRNKETIEVRVKTDAGFVGVDSVPSGTSTGASEVALVEPNLAIKNINEYIAPRLIGMDIELQQLIDKTMIDLDGTVNKSRMGGNAILGVSLAVARVAALTARMPLFWYLNRLFRKISAVDLEPSLPTPMMVMICGGKHGGNTLCIQEFLVITTLENGRKIWASVERILKKRRIKYTLGLEGAFSPDLAYDEDAIQIIVEAIGMVGLTVGKDVRLGLDIAGNNCRMSREQIASLWQKYGIYSLEDPFGENDWTSFSELKNEFAETGKDFLVIGDDLFATHKDLLQKGINNMVANGIIIKVNQIGTVSEALEVIALAKKANFKCVVSHRSGETTDTFIADLAVGVGAEYLKSGAPIPKERLLKYKRLEEISKEL